MKKLLSIFLLIPTLSYAQLHAGIGGGYDFNCSHPVFTLEVGYEYNNIVIEAVEQPTITRAVNSANYFGMKAGYNFRDIIPAVGYYYNYASADDKKVNSFNIGCSLKAIKILNDNGGVFVEGLYVKSIQLTGGFYITF